MSVLGALEPARVMHYFEEICGIPHGSGNTKKISDYCVSFAKEHHLTYLQDEYNNVIIWKDGTKGYENSAPVMLQGHLDMVCEKEEGCDLDFETDGLCLQVKDGIVTAKKQRLAEMTVLPLRMLLPYWRRMNIHTRRWRLCLR